MLRQQYGRIFRIILGGLAAFLLVLSAAVYGLSESRMGRHYAIAPPPLSVLPDLTMVERGRHIAVTRGCTDCHADDLGGRVFLDEPGIARISATNLTRGLGGIGADFTLADWDRAIRHGVGATGRAIAVMPSQEYFGFSDADLATLIAYLSSAPPVDRELPPPRIQPFGRLLLTLGAFSPFAAELIDHDAARAAAPEEGPTVAYGRYLAALCTGCHGPHFAGGRFGPPGAPVSPNLTPAGMVDWAEKDFFNAMREGRRPDGGEIREEYMPWRAMAEMTDTELRALWLYFRSVAPRKTGTG